MTDEELSISDATLIARLREARKKRDEFEAVMLSDTAADRIEDFRNGISFALAWASRPIVNGTFEDRFEAYEQALITIDALLYGNKSAGSKEEESC